MAARTTNNALLPQGRHVGPFQQQTPTHSILATGDVLPRPAQAPGRADENVIAHKRYETQSPACQPAHSETNNPCTAELATAMEKRRPGTHQSAGNKTSLQQSEAKTTVLVTVRWQVEVFQHQALSLGASEAQRQTRHLAALKTNMLMHNQPDKQGLLAWPTKSLGTIHGQCHHAKHIRPFCVTCTLRGTPKDISHQ